VDLIEVLSFQKVLSPLVVMLWCGTGIGQKMAVNILFMLSHLIIVLGPCIGGVIIGFLGHIVLPAALTPGQHFVTNNTTVYQSLYSHYSGGAPSDPFKSPRDQTADIDNSRSRLWHLAHQVDEENQRKVTVPDTVPKS